jgi:hypothetical protein
VTASAVAAADERHLNTRAEPRVLTGVIAIK